MRHLIAIGITCAAFTLPAGATTFTTDASDLWFNPSEQGWGMNVIQQDDTLFITLFVYSSAGNATWYVGPATTFQGDQGNSQIYTGPLYQTVGPWFGGPFNPGAVGNRQVGTVTFKYDFINGATLTYVVDGVSVLKQVQRQTWKTNDIAGTYLGATIGTYTGDCGPSTGYAEEPATVTVTQSVSSVTIVASGVSATCTYSGAYFQDGRMGSINGSFACSNGGAGTFQAFEIEASPQVLAGRANSQFAGTSCTWSGRFGGLRRGN